MLYRFMAVSITALSIAATPCHGQGKAATITGGQSLARAKFIEQMDAQFRLMDVDKSGHLSVAEIEQFEKEKALAEARARNESLFDQLDANNNGQISATEFAKLMTEPAAASAQPMLGREDSNRDNQVSMAEHRNATLANFDRLDSNRDGVVTPVEMQAGGIKPR